MESITLGDIWQYSTQHPAALPPAQHTALELTFVLEGTASYQVQERTRQLVPGTTMWVFPSRYHHLLTASPNYRAWIATFPSDLVQRVQATFAPAGLAEAETEDVVLKRLGQAAAERLNTLFADIRASAAHQPLATNPAALSYLFVSAWAEQSYAAPEREAEMDLHPAVEKAAKLLRSNGGNITLEELAKTCGASSAWLSRLFRQQMGVSLVDYRNQHRIERFFELYRSGHRLNITQAALEAGFGSYAQFHRVFRKRVGYGPAELRRKLASNR